MRKFNLMGLSPEPITLGPEQVEDLHRKLAEMRHSVNNHLSLIRAAGEIILHKPELLARMVHTLIEQPQRITNEIQQFSQEFEKVLNINKDA